MIINFQSVYPHPIGKRTGEGCKLAREEAFGKKIKELRQQKGLSLRKAANFVDISHYRLDELEIGKSRSTGNPTRPSRDTVVKLAEVYGVPKDYLLELAGFARENPELSDDEALLVDLFRGLNEDQRELTLRLVQAIPRPRGSGHPSAR